MLVQGPGLEGQGVWYIDTDGNDKTGSAVPIWNNGSGIDAKISDGKIWRAVDGGWNEVGAVRQIVKGDVLEAEAELSILGAGTPANMRVGFALAGDQYLPAAGKLMLTVPPPSGNVFGPDLNVTVDADASDWSGAEPAAMSADGKTSLYAAEDAGSLVLLVQGSMAEFNDIYLDTDRSADTGYTDVGWPEFGGNWLIENGALFRSTGAGWNWAPVNDAVLEYKQKDENGIKTVEYRIPFTNIGLTGPKAFSIGFTSNDITVPDRALPAPLVAPPSPDITVDGSSDEWSLLPVTAQGEASVSALKAFAKDKQLYVLAQAASFDAETNIFINSDNDPDTGYLGWEFKRTGADYLIQNGKLFRSTGPGWTWEEIGPADWKVSDTADASGFRSLEAHADLSAFPDAGNSVRVAIGVGENYAPAKSSDGEYALASGGSGAPIAIDGAAGDWASIDNSAAGTGESVEAKAAQDDAKVYLLVANDAVDTRNLFYLDTDNNAATGFRGTGWDDLGADAKILYNKLYLYNKKNGEWTEAGPVRAEVNDSFALFYFYQDQIGRKKAKPLKIGYTGKEVYHLPAAGGHSLALKEAIPVKKHDNDFVPRERFDVLDNPFMGWAGWGDAADPLPQPHKLVYANINWRDLEPVKGTFDWAGVEQKFQFAKWRAEGSRLILRFVLDDPGNDPEMDIPQWLYDELAQAEGESGAGKWYDTPSSVVGKGFAPNYSSPLLIQEHGRVLEEWGKRYDNDPTVAFIVIGSLGHWGEFHNWPEEVSGKFPSVKVSDQYVQQYIDAFPHKKIGMRKPYPIAASNRLGLFNDVFGSKGATDTWVNWTVDGWNEIAPYVEEGEDPAAAQAASKMPDFWKTGYSGGEFYNGNPLLSLGDDTIMETLRETRASHTSWLGPSSPAGYQPGEDITEGQQANIDLMHNTMGYRFVLESVAHDKKAKAGKSLDIRMKWNNKGVAPFYFEWPLALALVDSSGKLVSGSVQRMETEDVTEWLPGRRDVKLGYTLPRNLHPGKYALAVAILDPDTGLPGVSLAIEGARKDGWTTLDSFQATR
ncbi:DUF4832 domain-containing protein [Paenibacillus sp. T1]|uniref:DUF4832 domain-containing protein n=1 Tax=Paenibacillus glycinis TaxID=2697035 RepID=A0ABW9XIF4_9BACL|nr:DUF4832 domain-containing protein [Paenibacillus glycinis]